MPRGGGKSRYDLDDDCYDEDIIYDEDEDENEEDWDRRNSSSRSSNGRPKRQQPPSPRRSRPSSSFPKQSSSRRRPPPYSTPPQHPGRHKQSLSSSARPRQPHPQHRHHQRPNRRPVRPPPPPSIANKAASLAKKSLDATTSAAFTTIKGTGKAAFYLASPKYVSRRDILGVWRLDQMIVASRGGNRRGSGSGDNISCVASIEFHPNGDATTQYGDETFAFPFVFRERSWPRSCTIEFQAKAFQNPRDERGGRVLAEDDDYDIDDDYEDEEDDDGPISYFYVGSFRRKVADPNVIKVIGKIYEVKKGIFGRGTPGKGVEVGSFVGRRRVAPSRVITSRQQVEQEYDDDDDDEYDEYYDSDDDEEDDDSEYDDYDEYEEY